MRHSKGSAIVGVGVLLALVGVGCGASSSDGSRRSGGRPTLHASIGDGEEGANGVQSVGRGSGSARFGDGEDGVARVEPSPSPPSVSATTAAAPPMMMAEAGDDVSASRGAAPSSPARESARVASPAGSVVEGDIATPYRGYRERERRQIQSGAMTAGTWDDNLNFDRFMSFRARQNDGDGQSQALPFSERELRASHREFAQRGGRKEVLDIALVIDTTGSMGDEIAYLQSEFTAISQTIQRRFPNSEQRWALVLYRDHGDDYVARWFDFRSDAEDFRSKLAQQDAGGGGDFPEAPDRALEIMNRLSWRSGNGVARLAFWIADAPHHAENGSSFVNAVRGAHELGVHVYPVASSGIDDFTELTMRTAAQVTGGRYIFLTDDSGIGNSHAEPSIPCYFVTRLDAAIFRMVDVEMSGVYREPSEQEVIRASGSPNDGTCELAGGQHVRCF